MPPINTFVFQCISDAQTEITISTYGTSDNARKRLEYHVKDVNNFKLVQ